MNFCKFFLEYISDEKKKKMIENNYMKLTVIIIVIKTFLLMFIILYLRKIFEVYQQLFEPFLEKGNKQCL